MSTTARRLVALLAGVLLALTACGASTDPEVRPFSEVQDSPFVFEADPFGTDGIFRVTTTEPMICAIVWGETEDFGNFNNSLAMSGTGIVEHDVVLVGAEPGVEYVFKVQGSTADGTLYESEVGTFVIPDDGDAEPPAVPDADNLAVGATIVEASSEFSDAFAAEFAVDGDPSTEWSTDGSGDDAHLTIDLGEPVEIGGVAFVTRAMADGSAVTETFTVTVDDGDPLGPFPAGTLADAAVADVTATGQVVRFDVDTSTGGNTGAVEVQVFGP